MNGVTEGMEQEQAPLIWHQTLDFDTLMYEARKHIAALAEKGWSNHNSADPGITILEVLAFCIADLSYRTSFDVKDILSGYKGGKQLDIDLPLADSALSTNPVTINDLRKALIDMPHPDQFGMIKNAPKLLLRNVFPIIAERTEIPFYVYTPAKKDAYLSFVKEFIAPADKKKILPTSQEIILNGLYSLQLEFENRLELSASKPYLADLNQNYFSAQVATANGMFYEISVLLPYWDEIRWSLRNVQLNQATLVYNQRNNQDYFIAVDKLNYDDYFYDYYAELNLNGHLLTAYVKQKDPIRSKITIQGINYPFSVAFLDWNELSNGVDRDYNLAIREPLFLSGPMIQIDDVRIDDSEIVFDIQTAFNFPKQGSSPATTKHVKLLTRVVFDAGTVLGADKTALVKQALEVKFPQLYQQQIELEKAIHDHLSQKTSPIYSNYLEKINTVFNLLYGAHGVWSTIGQYRNLGEDYSKFTASRVQEIALFGTIIAAPEYNINELLAEVYFRVDRFLNPLVRFNSLSEMTEKGYLFEELFNGPQLKHGFIEDSDLEQLKRRSVVYTSDLIRLIMDVPGVKAVADFSISSYIDNRLMGRNVINCLNLTNSDVYKPRFSAPKTALLVKVDTKTEPIDKPALFNWYAQKLANEKSRQFPSGQWKNLALPLGEDMEIEAYGSVQYDFPEVYGIDNYGLPIDATEERKARAQQLKAYLLPFEQLLANYLKQVAHLPELFSFNRTIDATYATQPLYDVPNVQPLFSGFVQSGATWDVFVQDLNNTYRTALSEGESVDEFRSRRSRFLSHMLARFGERFADYSAQMFDRHKALLNDPQTTGDYLLKRGETLDKLISDKIAFAENYPKVTGERYRAFDTTFMHPFQPAGTWSNSIVESYKLRLCRLLGIENTNNQFLFGTGINPDGSSADLEGIHVVEHILLRPHLNTNTLLTITNRIAENGEVYTYSSDRDPYSFKVTLVIPINAGRFAEEAFRSFAEKLIRMETPAHIALDLRWMSTECGKKFEASYSEWKKYIYLMKPYLFQNQVSLSDTELQELMPDIPLIDQLENPISLSDIPIKKLKSDASLMAQEKRGKVRDIKVPPKTQKGPSILTLQNNLVQSLNSVCRLKLDTFNVEGVLFSPIKGQIGFVTGVTDVFHLSVNEIGGTLSFFKWDNDWKLKAELKNVPVLYFGVEKLIGKKQIGLTAIYGGAGEYLLKYTLPNGDSTWQRISVSLPIVPVRFSINAPGKVLDFDTEKDGVFRSSNFNWEGYFLSWTPKGGMLTVSVPGSSFPPVVLGPMKEGDKVLFSDIYKQFGTQLVEFKYALDQQVATAHIQLQIEPIIKVYNQQELLVPNESGSIMVPSGIQKLDLRFEPPGGTLKVFNANGNTISVEQKTIDLMQNTTSKQLKALPEISETNPVPMFADGSMITLPTVSSFAIDILADGYWLPETTYLFHYSLSSAETIVRLVFPAPTVDEPIEVVADTVHVWTENTDDTLVTVRNSVTDVLVLPVKDAINLVFDYRVKKQLFDFQFTNFPGSLTLLDKKGKEYLFDVKDGRLTLGEKDLPVNDYKAVYAPDFGKPLVFKLDVLYCNPTFKIGVINGEKNNFKVVFLPAFPFANGYVWRLNDRFASRLKNPELVLDFAKTDKITVSLTIRFPELEATYQLDFTADQLMKLKNG
jgi:hypothetical protein